MLITRKARIPLHWVFYAQIPFMMAIAANYAMGAPFLFAMKKFIDNPAAITTLLSIEVFVTILGGPFASWLSDRIWTRYGRRKLFVVISNIPQATACILMPFAPDLMWLIIFRWIYGIFGDIGSPNQALTMEVVPAKQRGMGSGFFKLQGNLVNLIFWGLLFGRLDDVYFTGPFFQLASVPGETLVFIAGGILLLAICFYTFYGMHEVEPPTRLNIDDERRPGESIIRLFLRTFFKDVFGRDLLPLYLLLIVGTLTNVGLGILGPLLYTEQWGFTKQEMGTNVAVGAILGIFTAILSGWIADRTSKMTVYLWALILGLMAKIGWTIYVFYLPDHQPTLTEVIVSGNIQFLFGQLAGVVSFPLILEYVERNRLGTAGAGMGVFNSTIKQGFTMFIGFYVLWWSIFFLPQAGDRVEVVMRDNIDRSALISRLEQGQLPADGLDLEPVHRPGVDLPRSRHWVIRQPQESAGAIHGQIKDLTNALGTLRSKIQNPYLGDETRNELKAEIEQLAAEKQDLESQLQTSASSFTDQVKRVLAGHLVDSGSQILAASLNPAGTEVQLDLSVVEPVTQELAELLPPLLQNIDINTHATQAGLHVEPLAAPLNGLRVTLHRDPNFVALERHLLDQERDVQATIAVVSDTILTLRGFFGSEADQFRITQVAAQPNPQGAMLQFSVERRDSEQAPEIDGLRVALEQSKKIDSVQVITNGPSLVVHLQALLPERGTLPEELRQRLRSCIPSIGSSDLASLSALYQRIEAICAARPVNLTMERPIVSAKPADRVYDYFFSVQWFMIITDVFGLGVIFLIFALERRGVISRRGALEDEGR